MVEAEQVEDSGVEIVDMAGILDDVPGEVVGFVVESPRREPPAPSAGGATALGVDRPFQALRRRMASNMPAPSSDAVLAGSGITPATVILSMTHPGRKAPCVLVS